MDFLSLVATLTLDSSKYESGLSSAKGLASSVGKGISTGLKLAGAAIGAATTAVVGFGASSVKTGMSFDKSMSQVAATMGMTSSEMEKEIGSVDLSWGTFTGNLTEYAMEMGEKTQFSATEAADALNYMALAGYDAQTSMSMLPNVLNLAAAGSMELASASDMITDTQTAFGISLERTTQMVDEMAKAASTGNTDVNMLGSAFLTVGALAQELNGGMVKLADGTKAETDGVQELETALVAMANAGIKGSEAGTHMRNMITKLSDPTDDGVAALEKMGVTVFDTEGKMRSLGDVFGDLNTQMEDMSQESRIGIFADLFNTRDMSTAKSIMLSLSGEFVKFKDEVYSVEEAYEKFGDAIYDTSQGFEYVQTSWDQIGEAIQGASEAGVLYEGKLYSLKEAQEQFGDAINDTEQGFKILGAAEFMAIQQQDNLAGDMTKFDSALNGVKIRVSNELTPSLRTFAQSATDSLSRVSKAIKEGGLEGGISELGKSIADGLTQITVILPDAINAGISLMGAIAQGMAENAPAIGQALMDAAGMITETGLSLIQSVADNMASFDWTSAASNIATWLTDALTGDEANTFISAGMSILASLVEGIGTAYEVLAPAGADIITSLTTSLIDNADGLIQAGLDLIVSITKGMMDGQIRLLECIPQIIVALIGAILRNAPQIVVTVGQVALLSVQRVLETLPTLVVGVANLFAQLITMIVSQGPSIVTNAVNVAVNVVTGIINAIINLPNTLASWAGRAVGMFISSFGDMPSKMAPILTDAINKVIEFGKKFIKEAPDMAKKFVKELPENLKQLPSKMKESGKKIVDGLRQGITNAWDSFISWIKQKALSIVSSFLSGIKEGAGGGSSKGSGGSKSKSASVSSIASVSSMDAASIASLGNSIVLASHSINGDEQLMDYEKLAGAMVKALEQTDMTMEVDGREFGRVVRKAVAY